MIAEALLIGGIGAVAVTVADHENLFQTNPTKLWWWERPPFKPAPPAATINRAFQPQPHLSPAQELAAARQGVVGADQVLNYVSQKYPHLAVASKYTMTQPQQPDLVYRPKTYP